MYNVVKFEHRIRSIPHDWFNPKALRQAVTLPVPAKSSMMTGSVGLKLSLRTGVVKGLTGSVEAVAVFFDFGICTRERVISFFCFFWTCP